MSQQPDTDDPTARLTAAIREIGNAVGMSLDLALQIGGVARGRPDCPVATHLAAECVDHSRHGDTMTERYDVALGIRRRGRDFAGAGGNDHLPWNPARDSEPANPERPPQT